MKLQNAKDYAYLGNFTVKKHHFITFPFLKMIIGGDCCGNVKTNYCTECKCKDPSKKPKPGPKGKCKSPKWKGDGYCDDENNNYNDTPGCAYDGMYYLVFVYKAFLMTLKIHSKSSTFFTDFR